MSIDFASLSFLTTFAFLSYRVLKIFLSRTAQRVPYMSSRRVLKMLALILLLVLWFLAAWTVSMLENIEKNIPLVVLSQTTRGLQFYICDHDRWDYMMVVGENQTLPVLNLRIYEAGQCIYFVPAIPPLEKAIC